MTGNKTKPRIIRKYVMMKYITCVYKPEGHCMNSGCDQNEIESQGKGNKRVTFPGIKTVSYVCTLECNYIAMDVTHSTGPVSVIT